LEKQAALGLHMGHPLLADGARATAPNFHFLGMMNCKAAAPLKGELAEVITLIMKLI